MWAGYGVAVLDIILPHLHSTFRLKCCFRRYPSLLGYCAFMRPAWGPWM